MVHAPTELQLHDIVSDYFKTENFGVKAVPPILSAEDIRAKEILEATTLRINGKFQVGLLWKSDHIVLPESFTMALKRLVGIERKMKRNTEFAAAYSEIIDSYVKRATLASCLLTKSPHAIRGLGTCRISRSSIQISRRNCASSLMQQLVRMEQHSTRTC